MIKKIISYNVNGLRAAMKKGFTDWLKSANPNIICLQEIKATPDQIDVAPFEDMGFYLYWHPAEKKGYSGVAILTKENPDSVIPCINIAKYDSEGRYIRADFGDITLINSYFPSGTMGDVRQDFKMNYLNDFLKHIDSLKKQRPNLIISGDFNICHKPIDINHPEWHEDVSGFLPKEREWFDSFINLSFIDTFRVFNKDPYNYSWWSYRAGARPKNLGWRIDYHLISEPLRSRLKNACILKDVYHSDHCPVVTEIDF
ncbi:MAG: exodeoxyribonuclease III [Bacteroidia bacterium]|nr:exodeoxyribonuclease III [Bacteroidia bacterium]